MVDDPGGFQTPVHGHDRPSSVTLARAMLPSRCMARARRWFWNVGGGSWLAAVAIACSSFNDSTFDKGPENAGAASDAGPAPPSNDGPTEDGVIVVHAASTSAFRLCFENDLERQPAPESELMPEANVVGVEVGSVVRIPPLKGPPGEVYLFSEPLIRALYRGSEGPTCRALIESGTATTTLGNVTRDLSKGIHLLVVSGCPKKTLRAYTTEECGSTYDAEKGNLAVSEIELKGISRRSLDKLPMQVLHLSRSLESLRGARPLRVTFGDITDAGTKHDSVATDPTLGGPPTDFVSTPSFESKDVSVYAKLGFRVTIDDAGTLAEQSMASVQALSAPRDVPPSYYSAASNYVLLLLGEPAALIEDAGVDTDERRHLHFIAVPVLEPKEDAGDAGAEGDGSVPSSKDSGTSTTDADTQDP